MQGYSREAEGEAQPVQEADLIAQQMTCQQQRADFLRAEKQEGEVMGGMSGPLQRGPGTKQDHRVAGLRGREEAPGAWGNASSLVLLRTHRRCLHRIARIKETNGKLLCPQEQRRALRKAEVGSPQLLGEDCDVIQGSVGHALVRASSCTTAANGTVQ